MKAHELLNHFLDRAPYVNRDNTVDRIVFGDPQAQVRSILVTWMADFPAIERAIEIGADTIMTHEPTVWVHANERGTFLGWADDAAKKAAAAKKIIMLEDRRITVIRNHDVWDRFPDVGIPFAWAKFIGVEGKPAASAFQGYQLMYEIPPVTLEGLARRIAAKTALLDEPHVPYFGDGSKIVSRLGVGTGAICPLEEFVRMGCDVSVVTDDGSCFWEGIAWTRDAGHAVIRVAHPTSEEAGMQSLCKYVNENIQSVSAEYFRTPFRYHYV